jgi:hypothetical protein
MGDAALWVSIALAAVYLPAGLLKIAVPKGRLVSNSQFGWAAAVPQSTVKAIGGAEILGALGVIAPRLTGIAPVIGVAAAWGLAAVQIGAIVPREVGPTYHPPAFTLDLHHMHTPTYTLYAPHSLSPHS